MTSGVFHEFPAPIMVLNESGAAFHPIAIIHIDDAVYFTHFGNVDVAAYGAVKAFTAAIRGDVPLEIVNVIQGALGLFLQSLG